MELDEIARKKERLTETISDLIYAFEEDTKVIIDRIEYDNIMNFGGGKDGHILVLKVVIWHTNMK